MFSILKLKKQRLTILKKDDTTLFCRVLATKSIPHWAQDTTSRFYFVVFVVFCRVCIVNKNRLLFKTKTLYL